MALPKLSQPIFTLELPSNGKKVRYRQFTVKEEKILLVAQASGDRADMIEAFKQLIQNCCLDSIDVDALPAFDIEYFFIQLRAKSVSNVVKLSFEDEDNSDAGIGLAVKKRIEVNVNLDEVQVHKPTVGNKIILDDTANVGVILKYPNFQVMEELLALDQNSPDTASKMLKNVMETIFDATDVYPVKDTPEAELDEFIDSLNNQQIEKIQGFLEDMPYVYIDVRVGERVVRVKGIESFFE
jgi:hypothetical protein